MNAKKVYLNALREITLYYGDKTAERSRLPLMNHIVEGCAILETLHHIRAIPQGLNNLYYLKAAFCLHPIEQNENNYCYQFVQDLGVVEMAQAYSKIANHYLCVPENDHITSYHDLYVHMAKILEKHLDYSNVMLLLYVDKLQNRKDFITYHQDNHKRSYALTTYFDVWLEYIHQFWLTGLRNHQL